MKSKIVILDDSVLLYQNYIENVSWEKVLAYARGGLTYLIQNNGIRFFASHDWLYKNLIASLELPLYIIDEESGIDGEYDDIQQITEILNNIFPSANGDTDLKPYLKKREAEELYQPIGDYLTKESGDTLYQPIGDYVTDDELSEVLDDYYTKEESDEKYQPTGDYLSANSLVGYATEQWVENKGYIDKIKTINNQSLLGEGNIEISGGTADAYTKAEADERFQPIGDYVSRTTFITYISNLTQQIESLQDAIEECCSGSGETIYRWITLTGPNDYVCSGTSKYTKEQKQQSTDNGATWQNVSPAEYRAGILIETDSPDCGYEPVIEYRWVTVSGEYVCSGTTKYNKEKKQYRVDGGDWIDTSPLQTRRGSIVIETQSPDCGYVPPQYRWWQAPASDYICSGTTKYYKEYYQVSYDGGSTWQNVSPEQTRRGAVIESQSTDCGYVPSLGKYRLTLNDSTVINGSCNSSSSVTNAEVSSYTSTVVSVEIGSCVNKISIGAFDHSNNLSSVTIGNNVRLIDYAAFAYCSGLTSVTLPNGLTTFGQDAFSHCRSLTGVTLPNSVTSINNGVFYECSSLQSIVIPDSVTSIGVGTFLGCVGLKTVTIGSGVTSINNTAFLNCSCLSSITCNAITPPTLGENVFAYTNNCPIYVPCQSVAAYKTAWAEYESRIRCEAEPQYRWWQAPASDYICSGTTKYYKEYYQVSYDGGSTWQNVTPIQTRTGSVIEYDSPDCGYVPTVTKYRLTLKDSTVITATCDYTSAITSGEVSTQYRTTLKSAEIGSCNTTIDNECFSLCSGMTSVTIPDSITIIGNEAFRQCYGLTSVTIPNSVQRINISAFITCKGLTGITIPSSVKYVGQNAFANCDNLTSVIIDSGVTSIDSWAFYRCRSLQSITVNATTPPTIGDGVFDSTNNCTIYVPAESVNAYKSASGWSDYASRIQAIP